jgi:hypothetical protein
MSHETTAQSMCLRWLASKATFMAAKEPHEYQACHRRADSEPAGRIRADAESKGKGVLHRDVAPAFRRKPMWGGYSPNAREWQELRPCADQRGHKRRPGQYTARPRTAELSRITPPPGTPSHQKRDPKGRGAEGPRGLGGTTIASISPLVLFFKPSFKKTVRKNRSLIRIW